MLRHCRLHPPAMFPVADHCPLIPVPLPVSSVPLLVSSVPLPVSSVPLPVSRAGSVPAVTLLPTLCCAAVRLRLETESGPAGGRLRLTRAARHHRGLVCAAEKVLPAPRTAAAGQPPPPAKKSTNYVVSSTLINDLQKSFFFWLLCQWRKLCVMTNQHIF